MYVYKLTNKTNGMLYIGITTCSLAKRWREHKCAAKMGRGTPLYRAMRRYGPDMFDMTLEYEGATRKDIERVEKELIAKYGTYIRAGNGYNLTLGGEGQGNIRHAVGENFSSSVLTDELVAFIRSPKLQGKSNRELVEMLAANLGREINTDTVKSARHGKTWKHLNVMHPPIVVEKGTRQAPASKHKKQIQLETLNKYHYIAIAKAAELRRGKRGRNAKLPEQTVEAIFYEPLSLNKTAMKYGISKKMVLNIKQRKAHVYLTKGL